MKIVFSKYEGAGNDFIIIDNRRAGLRPNAESVATLCDRHFGIGADGLMLLDACDGVDFGMTYYNSDGHESTMCGNGGRCMMAFARSLGLGSGSFRFRAIDGDHEGEALAERADWYRLKMNDVTTFTVYDDGLFLDTGSPHFVRMVGDAAGIDVFAEGRMIRFDPRFAPGGTNADFAQLDGQGLFVRTYERGVEGETLSCGTGVTASAIACEILHPGRSIPFRIRTLGGELTVSFRRSGDLFTDVWLEGPARFVFSGDITIENKTDIK